MSQSGGLGRNVTAVRNARSGGTALLMALAGLMEFGATALPAQPNRAFGFDPYVTFSANVDAGYRKTQFFQADHSVGVGQWDSRVEGWLPPFRDKFSWGPYLRLGGIAASRPEAWENAWLAGPGVGFQVFPFSLSALRKQESTGLFGPLRGFVEYNRLNYWGQSNSWRPKSQKRIGIDYWRALHVNDGRYSWWAETWNGLWWQSANEFDPRYNGWTMGNALRAGVRLRGSGIWSAVTPYAALDTSVTNHRLYYWENRLLAGGGLRVAPALERLPRKYGWFNRFALYAEYLRTGVYYRQSAPDSIPKYDVRFGVTASIGQWYR